MPIFMDRHDLTGMSAEDLAQAHQMDLEIQDEFGVKFMTYWFDEVRKTAFCLVQAPNKQALQDMHNEAHGAVAERVATTGEFVPAFNRAKAANRLALIEIELDTNILTPTTTVDSLRTQT